MDGRDHIGTLSVIEDEQSEVGSTRAAWSVGRPTGGGFVARGGGETPDYRYRLRAYRSSGAAEHGL